jgi:hypothetical protein
MAAAARIPLRGKVALVPIQSHFARRSSRNLHRTSQPHLHHFGNNGKVTSPQTVASGDGWIQIMETAKAFLVKAHRQSERPVSTSPENLSIRRKRNATGVAMQSNGDAAHAHFSADAHGMFCGLSAEPRRRHRCTVSKGATFRVGFMTAWTIAQRWSAGCRCAGHGSFQSLSACG